NDKLLAQVGIDLRLENRSPWAMATVSSNISRENHYDQVPTVTDPVLRDFKFFVDKGCTSVLDPRTITVDAFQKNSDQELRPVVHADVDVVDAQPEIRAAINFNRGGRWWIRLSDPELHIRQIGPLVQVEFPTLTWTQWFGLWWPLIVGVAAVGYVL